MQSLCKRLSFELGSASAYISREINETASILKIDAAVVNEEMETRTRTD